MLYNHINHIFLVVCLARVQFRSIMLWLKLEQFISGKHKDAESYTEISKLFDLLHLAR
jgi:hypothetical protein